MSNALSASEVNILNELLTKVRDHSIDIANGLSELYGNHPLYKNRYNDYKLDEFEYPYLTYDESDNSFRINDYIDGEVEVRFDQLAQSVESIVKKRKDILDNEYKCKIEQNQASKEALKKSYINTIKTAFATFPELKDEIK